MSTLTIDEQKLILLSLTPLRIFVRKFSSFFLFVIGIDPLAIYKDRTIKKIRVSRCGNDNFHFERKFPSRFLLSRVDERINFSISQDSYDDQSEIEIEDNKNHIYHLAEFRLEETKIDVWRRWWNRIIGVYVVYLIIKFSTIAILQSILEKCSLIEKNMMIFRPQNYLRTKELLNTNNISLTKSILFNEEQQYQFITQQSNLNQLNNSNVLMLNSIEKYGFKFKILHYALRMSELIGNPIMDLPGASIFVYTAIAFNLSHAVLFLPYYYARINPLDAIYVRFILEPMIEIKRVDYIIRERLDYILWLIQSNSINNNVLPLLTYAKSIAFQRLKDIVISLKESKNLPLMRPAQFSWSFHLAQYKDIQRQVAFSFVITAPWLYFINDNLTETALYRRCLRVCLEETTLNTLLLTEFESKRLSLYSYCSSKIISNTTTCSIWNHFSLLEGATHLECFVSLLMIGSVLVFALVSIFHNLTGQNLSIESMKVDIETCLMALKFCEIVDRCHSKGNFKADDNHNDDKNAEYYTINMDEKQGNFNYQSNISKQTILMKGSKTNESWQGEFIMDSLLLRTLIKLRITEEVIKKNNIFLSQMVGSYSASAGTALIMGIIGDNVAISIPQMKVIRAIFLIYMVMTINIVLLSCAYAYARTTGVSKLAWSTLAQMLLRCDRLQRDFQSDYICSSWRRLVHSQTLVESSSIMLFGMFSIRFRSVIEMNFVIMSIVSLLRVI